ncbi:MAG: ATP-binding protein [Desulfobacterales bacterium]|nr:ATP-binding protein [Desulfobacterales bacterium]
MPIQLYPIAIDALSSNQEEPLKVNNRKLTIEFEPTFDNVDIMRSAITGICQYSFPTPGAEALTMDFSLAVTEAMTNAVEHSGTNRVTIELTVAATAIIFQMTTNGIKFDPTIPVSFPDLSSSDDLPEGGFGLALIRELVDRVAYEYRNGKNIFTLEKTLICSEKETGDGKSYRNTR